MVMEGYAGSTNPRMILVGEAWGEDEAIVKQPFVGASGQELWRILGQVMPNIAPHLHSYATQLCHPRYGLAWVRRRFDWLHEARIGFTNVLNFRPPDNKLEPICTNKVEAGANYPFAPIIPHRYLKREYFSHIDRLQAQISHFKPNLVVALGNTACWALLGTTGINSIRGTTAKSLISGFKVLSTFHPASILYEGQWGNRPILISDLIKANRESAFPEIRRPARSIIINPSLFEAQEWILSTISSSPPALSIDVETSMGMIDTIGFSRSDSDALVIPFGAHRYLRGNTHIIVFPTRDGKEVKSYWTAEEEPQIWHLIRLLLASPIPKVFQNGAYDLQYIFGRMGLPVNNCRHDTMLAWHALFPEMPKSLGFLGSLLTDEVAWKQINRYKSDTTKREE